ncbi:MAG: DUF4920 domain-containing protein [Polyangiaceae bacterium]
MHLRLLCSLPAFFALVLGACRTEDPRPEPPASVAASAAVTSSDPSASVASASAASGNGAAKFGDAITITKDTPIAAVVKAPSAFQGKLIATEGVVKSVCQERGCWMTLTDDSNKTAMIRMHGHSFFVPKDASGKNARVQGTILLVRDEKECDEAKGQKAEIELDATGVELL